MSPLCAFSLRISPLMVICLAINAFSTAVMALTAAADAQWLAAAEMAGLTASICAVILPVWLASERQTAP